jgi:hypothetical protein
MKENQELLPGLIFLHYKLLMSLNVFKGLTPPDLLATSSLKEDLAHTPYGNSQTLPSTEYL